MKLKVEIRFDIGEYIHEVFWDSDIDAWNVCSWKVGYVYCKLANKKLVPLYMGDVNDIGISVEDSADLFETSLPAANEAKKRNHKMMKKSALARV